MKEKIFTVAWFTMIIIGTLIVARPTEADTTEPSIYAGVFRKQPGNKWLYTVGHASINIDWGRCQKVSPNRPAALVIKISNPGRQVGVPQLDPDETLTGASITGGASVTLDKVRIFFYKNGRPISCWHKVFDTKRSNMWVLGVTIR